MSKPKPKSAIARLLDNLSPNGEIQGAAIVTARTDDLIQSQAVEKNTATHFIKNIDSYSQLENVLANIDPNLCRPWQFADRPDDEMGDIESLANSLKEYGQQEPVLVRPVHNLNDVKYEVIFGNRRWRAAKRAGIMLLAIIKKVSDQEAALFQKEENENRKDLSDLARARSYQAQINAGIFKSEIEISRALGISRQNLNDIMAFNRIPEKLTNVIPNLKNISRKTAVKLAILSKDESNLDKLISLANKIGNGEITANNLEVIFVNANIKSSSYQKNTNQSEIINVVDKNGVKIFTLKKSMNGETIIKINKVLNGNFDVSKLKELIFSYLSQNKI